MKSTIETVGKCNDQEAYKRLFCRWPDQRTSDRRLFWGTTIILNTVLNGMYGRAWYYSQGSLLIGPIPDWKIGQPVRGLATIQSVQIQGERFQ